MDLDSALSGKPAEGASATDILRADHAEVRRLFAEYERVRNDAHARGVVAQSISMQLELHDTVEREIFYPAVRSCDPQRVADAEGEHAEIAAAAERLRMNADAGADLDESVSALKSLVEPHVSDEEQKLFRVVEERMGGRLLELGVELVKRKEALTRSTASFEGPAT